MLLWVGGFEEAREVIRSANTREGGDKGRTSYEIELS
jgi:hypothetical protein